MLPAYSSSNTMKTEQSSSVFGRKGFALIIVLFFSLSASAQLKVNFSSKRGLYTNGFSLTLTPSIAGKSIRYTSDGSEPTTSSGTLYSSPINISNTSMIRAIAYGGGDLSKVKTHTFIFPAQVINQPNSVSGFPTSGFAFDNSIKNHSTYGPQLIAALNQVPSISLVMDLDDLYDVHQLSAPIEYPCSVEYINPNNGDEYQANAGIERAGGSSFNSLKRNLRLNFKSAFGDAKFAFPIFGQEAARDFDQIALRPGFHGCMQLGVNSNRHGSNDLADQVMRDFQINMSEKGIGIHGDFMHLYINGIYWGVYNPSERGTNSFGESYFGGEKDDFDAIKRKNPIDGNRTAYTTLENMANNLDVTIPANYDNMKEYVDVVQFADYNILSNFGPHADDHKNGKNSFVLRDRTKTEGFKFFMWDTEPALGHVWTWNVSPFGSYPYDTIFQKLLTNSDFKTLVGDRLECHCFNDGALSASQTTAQYDKSYNSSKTAFIAEAARWRGSLEYDEFISTRNRIVNNYLPGRAAWTVQLYKNNNAYPSIDAVQFSQYGGALNIGQNVTLSNPNPGGTLYYTTNGVDPRASGGAISSSAQVYTGAISLMAGVQEIKARVKSGSTWSAMCPRKFHVDQDFSKLVINEIHYNPNDSIFYNPAINAMDTVDGKNFEFIELKNTSSESLHLNGLKIRAGVVLDLCADLIVPPNSFVVFAEDSTWFHQRYGFAADGIYSGSLSNSGDHLSVFDPLKNLVDSLTFDDSAPWNEVPDEGVSSLALLNSSLDNGLATNWSVQSVATSPGLENIFDPNHPPFAIQFNEIHYHPKDSVQGAVIIDDDVFEFIELKNTSNSNIDISGFFFSRGIEFKFPPNSLIPANGFTVIAKDAAFFNARYNQMPDGVYEGKLKNSGEELWLHNKEGKLIDAIDYGDAGLWDSIPDGSGYSLALLVDSTQNELASNWIAQKVETTLWAENQFCDRIELSTHNIEICAIDGLILSDIVQGNALGGLWTYNNSQVNIAQNQGRYFYNYETGNRCESRDSLDITFQIPDYSISMSIAPSAIVGPQQIRNIISISELNNEADCENIYVLMPKDISRFNFSFVPNASSIGGVSVQNIDWQYFSTNPAFHVWQYVGASFTPLNLSTFGFIGTYNPSNTDGQTSFTVQIFGGSGGETNVLNNADSESLIYFK